MRQAVKRMSANKDPLFWEWVKNRDKANKPSQVEDQPRMEILPMVEPKTVKTKEEPSNRGICIIEIF